jgi:hypothetical protein
MTNSELIKLASEKSNSIAQILKSKYPSVYSEINKLNKLTFAEKLYVYLYGEQLGCIVCGNKSQFKSFNKGYVKYCSVKCATDNTKLKRYESTKNTFIERYGVTSPSQLQIVKEKIREHRQSGAYNNVVSKMKRTKLEKYGDENYSNAILGRKTKLEKYGDENYNNRDKARKTLIEKYGTTTHPNILKSTIDRINKNEIGFGSDRFKEWLISNKIENTSQLQSVKDKKRYKKNKHTFMQLQTRLSMYVTPQFTESDFFGIQYYDRKYPFKCVKCEALFKDHLCSGHIPRCPHCFPKRKFTSVAQYEILQYLQDILPTDEIILNDRKLLNGLELDILIPSKGIAIEYNSLYFHSELSGNKDKGYHLNKFNLCKKNGIRLIQIMDIDWIYKQNIIKNRLNHILQTDLQKIYARNCTISLIPKELKRNFLSKYHIQGNDNSQIYIGAFYDQNLVAVMTFGILRKTLGSKRVSGSYELYRYASCTNIIGGASRLLQFFIKNYNPNEILTYSDNRWGITDFYEKIGFKFSHNSLPNYWYFNSRKYIKNVLHRSGFQKHKLSSKIKIFDPTLTEWQNMQLNGYDRIWDCGNAVYKMECIPHPSN